MPSGMQLVYFQPCLAQETTNKPLANPLEVFMSRYSSTLNPFKVKDIVMMIQSYACKPELNAKCAAAAMEIKAFFIQKKAV